jgi:putative flippase GtrA
LKTALWYTLFAAIATGVNLAAQFASFFLYRGFLDLYLAMAAGTAAGLVVKYVLDKKFIFFYTCETKTEDAGKFFLYTLMGGVTTLIFWGFEIAFDHLFEGEGAKYLGAVIGLAIGYAIKYYLDKRFVFKGCR